MIRSFPPPLRYNVNALREIPMSERFERTERLIGESALKRLEGAHVAVFGLGGVGGHCLESLVRMGIGELSIIDGDEVALSNLNRQIIATQDSIGLPKVDVFEKRAKSINSEAIIHKINHFYLPDDPGDIDFSKFDYVVDAIDTVAAKLDIIEKCQKLGVPIISALGCGNRLDPTKVRIGDLYETNTDPLARIMRHECRKRGIESLKVVYSTEPAIDGTKVEEGCAFKKRTPGSTPFVPAIAGIYLAYEVVNDLLIR